MVEPRLDANNEVVPYDEQKASNKAFRKLFSGTDIAAGGYVGSAMSCLVLK